MFNTNKMMIIYVGTYKHCKIVLLAVYSDADVKQGIAMNKVNLLCVHFVGLESQISIKTNRVRQIVVITQLP